MKNTEDQESSQTPLHQAAASKSVPWTSARISVNDVTSAASLPDDTLDHLLHAWCSQGLQGQRVLPPGREWVGG